MLMKGRWEKYFCCLFFIKAFTGAHVVSIIFPVFSRLPYYISRIS